MDGRWPGDVCQQLSMRFAIDRETILRTSLAGRAFYVSMSSASTDRTFEKGMR
jgi:hypothetical protein